jgi:chitin disaccharide deacetylase
MTTARKPSEPIFSDNAAAKSVGQPIERPQSGPAHKRTRLALVVTADDFGIGVATSRGILDAHRQGPVTATSVMTVTQDHVKASVPLLADVPELETGLHLVFTRCGHPPLVVGKSSGLVDPDNQFISNGRLWMHAYSGMLDRKAIFDEISAQAELFRSLLGRPPAYVDSHHHAHQLPVIRDALLEAMVAGVLPSITRITCESMDTLIFAPGRRLNRGAAQFIGQGSRKFFQQNRIWSNDLYFGMLSEGRFNGEFPWNAELEYLPQNAVVEWIVHPGLPDETLAGRDSYRARRPLELEYLIKQKGPASSPIVRSALSRKSVLAREAGGA